MYEMPCCPFAAPVYAFRLHGDTYERLLDDAIRMKRGGSVMSPEVRKDVSADPEYTRCGIPDAFGPHGGRVTREHSLIHAGKKIQEKWAIIPCCAAHHGVDSYQDAPTEAAKEIRVWVALNRATDEDLIRFSKAINYIRMRAYLNDKYGIYVPPPIPKV